MAHNYTAIAWLICGAWLPSLRFWNAPFSLSFFSPAQIRAAGIEILSVGLVLRNVKMLEWSRRAKGEKEDSLQRLYR
jgi:hypothetical protein